MATFDVTANGTIVFGATSITSASMSIASSADRAGVISVYHSGNSCTAITASLAGTSGSAISGTDTGTAQTHRTFQFVVIAPASGSQTATCSWTTATDAYMKVAVYNDCDQTAPAINGTSGNGASGVPTVTPTAGAGSASVACAANSSISAPTQTALGSTLTGTSQDFGASRGAAGATHSWATNASAWTASGCTLQSPALPGISLQPLDQTIASGNTASFDTTVTNATTLQWEVLAASGSGGWANVSSGTGGTTADYTTPTLTTSDRGKQYRLKATNANGDVYSNVVGVRITDIPASYDFGGFVIGAGA